MDPENDELVTNGRKRLHLADHGYVIWPDFTAVSSNPTVVISGDGGDFRLAAIAQGVGTATLTITRASDGATADVEVTVTEIPSPDPLPAFSVHLGESF